ncbi:MAG: D-aminoacylase, partial [Sphingomonadaceae bacterium]|nr:D-aminoacylase [Sphingomonadaceae bacterium]
MVQAMRNLIAPLILMFAASAAPPPAADLVIRGGVIYDGGGGAPYAGIVATAGDRIVYVGRDRPFRAKAVIDAHGEAVAPGFVNMLSHV